MLGGTFAPIHHGHLRLAIEARERLKLDEVRLIPTHQPPHRAQPAVPAARRLEWVRLAIEGEPGLVADDRELRRSGPSYTVDTLASLAAEFPESQLVLLLGADAALLLHTWHRWRDLPTLAQLVFFERPGTALTLSAEVQTHLQKHHALPPQTLRALDISSTEIRQLLLARRSLRGLVPEAVLRAFTPEDLEQLNDAPSEKTAATG